MNPKKLLSMLVVSHRGITAMRRIRILRQRNKTVRVSTKSGDTLLHPATYRALEKQYMVEQTPRTVRLTLRGKRFLGFVDFLERADTVEIVYKKSSRAA